MKNQTDQPIPSYFTDVNYSDARVIIEEMKRACAATVGPLAKRGIMRFKTAHCTSLAYPAGTKVGIGTRIELVGHLPVLAEYTARTLNDGRTFYHSVGYAAVMVSAQDVMAHGFQPDIIEDGIALHLYKWGRDNPQRLRDFADGFIDGCRDIGAEFGGGETGAVRHLVNPPEAVGDCPVIFTTTLGSTDPSWIIEEGNINPGDVIFGSTSAGPHVNGISAIMRLPNFPDILKEELPDGRLFGEAVMAKMSCPIGLINNLKRTCIKPKAMQAGSGGGVSKTAFGDRELTYHIQHWPDPSPGFRKILDHTDPFAFLKEFNADIGWICFFSQADADRAFEADRSLIPLGVVEDGKRGVNFKPQDGYWKDIYPNGIWLPPQEV